MNWEPSFGSRLIKIINDKPDFQKEDTVKPYSNNESVNTLLFPPDYSENRVTANSQHTF